MADTPDTPNDPTPPVAGGGDDANLPLRSPLEVARELAAAQSTRVLGESATPAKPASQPEDGTVAELGPPAAAVESSPTKHDDSRPTNVGPAEDGDAELQARIRRRLDMADAAPLVDPLLGSEIAGRFRVVSKIGEGGMGAVYRARQKNMDRDVAIKVLLGRVADNPTIVRRFHLEALAVSKLKSPHTIQIYDFGETDTEQLYIAMEFLEGSSLHDTLKRERVLAVRRSLRIAEQMARSLREAHGKGIVHRDLKPDNVFLISVGEDPDFVKVLDFGVAKLRESSDDGGTVTKTGTIFGTPKYMSPEQAGGKSIDARSDIYAIGIMLYEMMAGTVPFNSDSSLGMLIKHIQEPPTPIEEMRPDLIFPEEVKDLLDRLLAKSPDDRPQSAEALIRDIGKILDGLDDIYRNVVTSEEAQRIGLEITTMPRTRQNTRLNESAPEMVPTLGNVTGQTLTPGDLGSGADRRWRYGLVALLLLLMASLGTAGGVYASLEPLPESYRGFPPLAVAEVAEVPSAQVEMVTVAVSVVPMDAKVYKDGVEQPHAGDFMLKRVRLAAPEKYVFKAKGYKDAERTFEFKDDKTERVELTSLEAPKPAVVEVEPESPKPVRRPSGDKPAADKPTAAAPEETKPFEFNPGKVKDTKKSPAGAGPGGTKASPF
ncbi:MAG: serine/threonine protein kinase [Deltaproteobacteria bacterium]|nr:serine/threonine protein kinase [Deltaproteobacteria bacterium]